MSQVATFGNLIDDKNSPNLDSRTNCLNIQLFNFIQWKDQIGTGQWNHTLPSRRETRVFFKSSCSVMGGRWVTVCLCDQISIQITFKALFLFVIYL